MHYDENPVCTEEVAAMPKQRQLSHQEQHLAHLREAASEFERAATYHTQAAHLHVELAAYHRHEHYKELAAQEHQAELQR